MGYRTSVNKWIKFLKEAEINEISGVPIESEEDGILNGPIKETHTVIVDPDRIGSVVVHIKK